MTATGGVQDDRSGGRTASRTGGHLEWLRVDRTALLAVTLSLLTVLSVFAVPASGATFAGSESAASVDDGASAPDPLAKGGPPGGNGGGSGSNSGGGGSSGGSSSGGSSSGGGSDAGGSSGRSSSGNGGASGNGASNGGGSPDASNGNENGASNGNGNGASNGNGNNGDGHGPPEAPPGEAGSGGSSVSVTAGGPGERAGGASRGESGGPTSVVSVAVEGARAGERVDMDVSPAPVENDAVAFDGISLTVERDGDFTMRVTNSRGRLPGSPAFEPDQAAESLGRIRLDHSITNDEVEEVTYTFRVSKDRLEATDTDPEDVALFRHADDGWNELPTDVVGETENHYLLSSDSPGMSEFAVGAKRPDFDAFWADVGAGSVGTGEAVTVRGRVTNDGGADGVYNAKLVVDGEVVAERSITIAAGGTRQVNFRARLERPGARRVSINGVPAGEVTVERRLDGSEGDEADPAMAALIDRILDVSNALGITSAPADDAG